MKQKIHINIIFTICLFFLINIISHFYFERVDLTSAKKYSISKETKNLISNIEDIIFFKIYLHGDIPVEYKRLANELKYILNELKAYSKYIEYEFVDPSQITNEEYKVQLQKELYSKGITPVPHRNYTNNKMEETWIFPGLIATYKTQETGISLISKAITNNTNSMIETSINDLEYSLVSLLKTLTTKKKKIGLINGHGEMNGNQILSFKEMMGKDYQLIDLAPLNGQLSALDGLDAVIINNPKQMFDEKDKFIIDQFIMHGGKSIWILNGNTASMDSLERKNETLVMPIENRNLHDLLFKYGIRINNDIIQDIQAVSIPIVTHYIKEKPQWTFFPWTFFPLLNKQDKHIITKNISPIKSQFPSSIDIIDNDIQKMILLTTTPNTQIQTPPTIVNLELLKEPLNEELFNSGKKNIAVLLEGRFESVFTNRIPLTIKNNKDIQFRSNSVNENKIIVISDGSIIQNQFLKGQNLPIGFDKHTGKQYGNDEFMRNAIDYLLGNEILIEARSKNISVRLLNQQKIKSEKNFWQIFNLISPIIILLLIGISLQLIRKQKYQR